MKWVNQWSLFCVRYRSEYEKIISKIRSILNGIFH